MSTRSIARTAPASAVVVVLVLVAATACHSARAVADHEVTSAWQDGHSATLTLTNTDDAALVDWRLELTLADEISSVWNAVLVGEAAVDGGWRYTLAPPSWQAALPVGGSLAIGWIAATTGDAPATPTACRLDDEPIHCGDGGPSSTTSSTSAPPTTSTTIPTTTTTTPPGGDGSRFAPYLDTTLWPPADLDQLAADRGYDEITLAFVVTGDAPCAPAWGGVIPLADDHLGDEIDQLRAAGGDVVVSFGGANGTELAQSCAGVDDLAAAYRSVVDHYGLDRIDLDVEGGALGDAAANDRRSAALARLQADLAAEGRALEVSLTLPVLPSGLTSAGVAVVESALDAGVSLSTVNVMAMDYGPGAAPDPDGNMGRYAVDAATATKAQLAALLPALDDAALWDLVGITPMIGQNDVAGEVFTLDDAARVASFAEDTGVGLVSMWSATRDVPCAGGPSPWASPVCSGIDQQPGAFSAALGR